MDDRKWVYKSLWDFKLNIKPSQRKAVGDTFGNNMLITEKPKFVKFVKCILVIDENMAYALGLPIETIVAWVEASNDFGKRFWLIQSPEKVATKEEVAQIEKAAEEGEFSGVQVVHGVRKSGGGSKSR